MHRPPKGHRPAPESPIERKYRGNVYGITNPLDFAIARLEAKPQPLDEGDAAELAMLLAERKALRGK